MHNTFFVGFRVNQAGPCPEFVGSREPRGYLSRSPVGVTQNEWPTRQQRQQTPLPPPPAASLPPPRPPHNKQQPSRPPTTTPYLVYRHYFYNSHHANHNKCHLLQKRVLQRHRNRNLAYPGRALSGGPSLLSFPSRDFTGVPLQCAPAPALAGLGGSFVWALHKITYGVTAWGFLLRSLLVTLTTQQQQGLLNNDTTPTTATQILPLLLPSKAKKITTATQNQHHTTTKTSEPHNRHYTHT